MERRLKFLSKYHVIRSPSPARTTVTNPASAEKHPEQEKKPKVGTCRKKDPGYKLRL